MGYIYIFGTILFTVYGQLIIKWRINKVASLPNEFFEKMIYLFKLIFDPFIFSGLLSAFIASIFWMAAMTKFEISYAYPFMSISYVLVFFLSIYLFNESFTIYKVIGLIFVILGLIISNKSS